jgi:hypothetical protein
MCCELAKLDNCWSGFMLLKLNSWLLWSAAVLPFDTAAGCAHHLQWWQLDSFTGMLFVPLAEPSSRPA